MIFRKFKYAQARLLGLVCLGLFGLIGCDVQSSLNQTRCTDGGEGFKCKEGFAFEFDAGPRDTCEPRSPKGFCEANGMPCDPNFQAPGRCGETREVDCRQFKCKLTNASPECFGNVCRISACNEGFENLDGDPENGCECEVTEEVCDGQDNDCDGVVDEECACQVDGNEDGVCSDGVITETGNCQAPDSYTTTDDESSVEDRNLCDQLDNDCDGIVDEGCQCNYNGASTGVCSNGTIQADSGNCAPPDNYEGTDDESAVGLCDGLDNDCDGTVDENCSCNYDGLAKGVCMDGGTVDPSTGECTPPQTYDDTDDESTVPLCDELDNDCDGTVDEGCQCAPPGEQTSCYTGPIDSRGQGICTGGTQTCQMDGTLGPCEGEVTPEPRESCNQQDRANGRDEDCDGIEDEGCTCDYKDQARGVCQGSTIKATNGECEEPDAYQSSENTSDACDDLDNDCDGSVDEDVPPTSCHPMLINNNSKGICGNGQVFPFDVACQSGKYPSCNRQLAADETGYQFDETGCDKIDNDCDGTTDENPTDPQSVYTGGSFTCTLTAEGHAHCWGDDEYGQLGDGKEGIPDPQQDPDNEVDGGHVFKTLAPGRVHTCGIVVAQAGDSKGDVYCWGSNEAIGSSGGGPVVGRLGLSGKSRSTAKPTQIDESNLSANKAFVDVSSGRDHTCAVTDGGDIYCWGRNEQGQLGIDPAQQQLQLDRPVDPATPSSVDFEHVAAGPRHTCAIDSQGKAYCWGDNRKGQLGLGSSTDKILRPQQVASPADKGSRLNYQSISSDAGSDVTCALRAPSAVSGDATNAYCWGAERLIGAGSRKPQSSNVPVAVAPPEGNNSNITYRALDVGGGHTCAIQKKPPRRTTFCWGDNEVGQLGTGQTSKQIAFSPQPTLDPQNPGQAIAFEEISAGGGHSCGFITSPQLPQLKCWGDNQQAQLGRGGSSPVEAPNPKSYQCPSP